MSTALKFVKVKDISHIPRYLFEQVKPREFDVDRLYQFAPILFSNPLNLFGAFIDKSESVKGTMWTSYNPITNAITVHLLSVDREYFGKGIMREIDGILNKLKKKMGAGTVIGYTTRPRAIERSIGFKRSKITVMEK